MISKNSMRLYVFGFLAINSLLIRALWNTKARKRLRHLCYDFGFTPIEPSLNKRAVSDVITQSRAIRLSHPIPRDWNVSASELAIISFVVMEARPKQIFELGTFDGRTTMNLALNAPEGSCVYTIDLPGEVSRPLSVTPGNLIVDIDNTREIHQIYGDTLQYDFSFFYGKIDLVFIDAGHGYKNVSADSATALRLIGHRTGTIIWHDYGHLEGVTRAVDDLYAASPELGTWFWVEDTSLAILQLHTSPSLS